MNVGDPFQRQIVAAEGYLELGMPLDAAGELEEIEPGRRDASEVLAVRIRIYLALKTYVAMQAVARVLALRDPDNPQWTVSWAYAARRADCIESARRILVEAVERVPNVAIFHYNLACYECQLGVLPEARKRLERAFALDPRFRLTVLDDDDFEPLWNSL